MFHSKFSLHQAKGHLVKNTKARHEDIATGLLLRIVEHPPMAGLRTLLHQHSANFTNRTGRV